MSNSMEFVARNGQPPQVFTSQTAVNVRKKRLNHRICFTLIFVLFFVVFSVGLFGYLYHLDVRWSTETKNYDARMRVEFDKLEKQINKMREYEKQVRGLQDQVHGLQDHVKKLYGEINALKSQPSQNKTKIPYSYGKLPLGEEALFKPISVQTMEENPTILDVEETGLIDLAAIRAYKNLSRKVKSKELLKQINITGFLDKELLEKFRIKAPNVTTTPAPSGQTAPRRRTRPTLPTALPEPDPDPANDESEDTTDEREKVEDDDEEENVEEIKTFIKPNNFLQHRRDKRSAELANSGNVNLIDTEAEEFDKRNRSNPTDFSKTSLLNQTARVDKKIQCNSTPCEEPRKMPLLQKNTSRRSLQQMKKAPSVREISSPAGSEMEEESIDVIETRKTVIAAHFGADASKYSIHTHNYYDGNFHLRHPTGEYEDWRPSSWFDELNMNKHFALMNGDIKVHTPGLYFVYAQIFYSDRSDVNGYEVLLNKQVVLQCITSTFTLRNVTTKSNTCYTGGVIKCNAGDKISVKTVDPDKRVMLEASRSFVGMFKIGDFQSVK